MSAKQKKHPHVPATFDQVLGAIASSKYKDKKKIEGKKQKQKKK